MKKVLIGGPVYGLHNIGDEAILKSMLESFGSEADITVMSYGSDWIRPSYPNVKLSPIQTMYSKPIWGLSASPRKKIFQSIKNSFFPNLSLYREMDLFICGGGTILSDCPWHALHLVELAEKCGVPSVLWGVGMTTVKDPETILYIQKICNSDTVLHIYTRDEYVLERLISYGVKKDKITVCYDPAYMLRPELFVPSDYMTENDAISWREPGHKKICISLSGEADVTERGHIDGIREFIRKASENNGNFVFLVPTGCGEHCRDRDFLRSLKINDRTILIEKEFVPEHLIEFLAHMDLIVSSRLHCCIFGAITGTPSVSLIRNDKQVDFAQFFDLPAVSLSDVKVDSLLKQSAAIMENRDQLSAAIRNQVEKMRMQHINAVRDLFR